MGLFDTIKLRIPVERLPNRPTWLTQEYSDQCWWQSKSIEAEDGAFEIRADGTLWRLELPWYKGEHVEAPDSIMGFQIRRTKIEPVFMSGFTGDVTFYCGFDRGTPKEFTGKRHRGPWYEAQMTFLRGKHVDADIQHVQTIETWELLP